VILDKKVLPFYNERNLDVKTIITSKYSKYCCCGTSLYKNRVSDPILHPFEKYLLYKGITHERTFQARKVSRNGFVKQFCTQIRKEFRPTCGDPCSQNDLQNQLEEWLEFYNYEKSQFGFPNFGQPPYEILKRYQFQTSSITNKIDSSFHQFIIALHYDIAAHEYFSKLKYRFASINKLNQTFHFKNKRDREKAQKFVELINKKKYSFHNLNKKSEALILREKGLNPIDVAYKIGVHRNTVKRWEKKYIKFGFKGLYDKRYPTTFYPY